MPGILALYSDFAGNHVARYEKKGSVTKISRDKVERQLLEVIDSAQLPIDYKLSWYHAVLASTIFDSFWTDVSVRLNLPKACTKRYAGDQDLLEYEAPTDDQDEDEEDVEDAVKHVADDDVEAETHEAVHDDAGPAKNISPTSMSKPSTPASDHGSRSTSPDTDRSSRSSTPENSPELSAAALAPVKRVPWCTICRQSGHITYGAGCRTNGEEDDAESSSDPGFEYPESEHEARELGRLLGQKEGLAVDDPRRDGTGLRAHYLAESYEAKVLAWQAKHDGAHKDSPSKSNGKDEVEATLTVSGEVSGPTRGEGDDSAHEDPGSSTSRGLVEGKATPTLSGDVNGLAREGDDGVYEDSPSKSKGVGKAKATPTFKEASKPKGVTKNRAAPKKKEQTPAQLKTAAAKTREPAEPKAAKKAAAKPSPAVCTPAPAEEKAAPAKAAGVKRQLPEDEDDHDSPASKKAKVSGAASENGGRKKATPKKSGKKKSLEEWDGIPRGFGEY